MTSTRLKIVSVLGLIALLITTSSDGLELFSLNSFVRGALIGLSISAMFLFVSVAWEQKNKEDENL